MTHSEFYPDGAYRNRLDELKVALGTIHDGLKAIRGSLPLDDLKQLSGRAKTVYTESTTARNTMSDSQGDLGSASMTLDNSDRILNRSHPDFTATLANCVSADKQLDEAKTREAYCAETGDQTSSALAQLGQEMSVTQTEISASQETIGALFELIAQAEGILGPPTY